jgi:hypothetical protein
VNRFVLAVRRPQRVLRRLLRQAEHLILRRQPIGEKRYLTAASVERALLAYERTLACPPLSTASCTYADDERVAAIPRRHGSRWASLYRSLERMDDGALADRLGRELELA